MAPPGPQLHLNLNILNAGFHAGTWRWPGAAPTAFMDVRHDVECARVAEQGCLDAVFLADKPGLVEVPEYRPFQALDPLLVLTSIAAATLHIGLIATASTSFNSPYNLARRFATLDHISNGRAGWNAVTTAERDAAQNFGQSNVAAHAKRYRRADECLTVVKKLWNSWTPDVRVADPPGGRLVDPTGLRPPAHRGPNFSVAGALTLPRSPQGYPLLVQAGISEDGQQLATAHADLVFSLARTLEQSQAFIQALQRRSLQAGHQRRPLVLPGLMTIIGDTHSAAVERERAFSALIPIEYGIARLARILHIDPGCLHPDRQLPDPIDVPADGNQTMFDATSQLARSERLNVRELATRLAGGAAVDTGYSWAHLNRLPMISSNGSGQGLPMVSI